MYMVVYDIVKDNLRNKVAQILIDYGFERIQLSVFVGDRSRNIAEMVAMEIKQTLRDEEGDVRIIPLCKKCENNIMVVKTGSEVEVK